MGILGIWFAYSNATALLHRLKSSRDKKLEPRLKEAYQAVTDEKHDVALGIVSEIQKKAQTQWMRSEAARVLIFTLIKQERYKEAEVELTKFYGLFGPEHYLQGVLSFQKAEMSQAIPHLQIAFDQSADYQVGLMLSQALMAERRYSEVLDLCSHPAMSEAIWSLSVNLQIQAFKNNEFEIAGRAGALAYEQKPDPNIAYNAGCAFARASDSTQALVWLQRAIASVFSDKNVLATDPDLESIRSQPGFVELLERVGRPTL